MLPGAGPWAAGQPAKQPRMTSHRRALWLMGAYGFACGLPLPLSGFTLRQWMTESDVSLVVIGYTASIGLPYSLKFLWGRSSTSGCRRALRGSGCAADGSC